MPRCPKCGTQVSTPQRTWTMAGRPDPSGFRVVLTVGLFECTSCQGVFRAVLSRSRQLIEPTVAAEQITCPNCGHVNARDRDYCGECRTLFSDKWT